MTTRQPLQGHLAAVLLWQECVAMAEAFADLKSQGAEMVFEVRCLTSGVTWSTPCQRQTSLVQTECHPLFTHSALL